MDVEKQWSHLLSTYPDHAGRMDKSNSLEYVGNAVGLWSRSQGTRLMCFRCNVLNAVICYHSRAEKHPRAADVAKQEKHFCGLSHSAMTSISVGAAEAAPQKPLNQSAGCETCITCIFPRRAWVDVGFTSIGHWALSESRAEGEEGQLEMYVLLDTKGFNLLWI
jgi:hypothetical protein